MWFVVTSLLLVVVAECRFVGDHCEAEGRPGVCTLLPDCRSLLNEVKRGGTPMPGHLRRRLQILMCGFDNEHPIVCCSSEDRRTTEPPYWSPHSHEHSGSHSWDDHFFSHSGGSPWDSTTTTTKRPWRQTTTTTTETPKWRRTTTTTERTIWITTTNTKRPWTRSTTTERPAWTNNRNDPADGNEPPPDVTRHSNLRLLPTDCGVIEGDRIWGGNRTRLYEMPWMVLIAYDSARGPKFSCGGTLIHERYVLTAAHCVSFLGQRLRLSGVILGEYDVRTDPDCERVEGEKICAPVARNVSIDTVIPHPGYSPQNLFDDIALIRLSERADFTLDNMKPVCLPTTPELQSESLEGQQLVVAGWGATEDGLQSPVLLSVALPSVSNRDCQAAYNGSPHIYSRQMCAGGVRDKDSCGGDSGGPLLNPGVVGRLGARYVQRGVVSYGSKRCGVGGLPGVYTRVAHYMDWILDNIRE